MRQAAEEGLSHDLVAEGFRHLNPLRIMFGRHGRDGRGQRRVGPDTLNVTGRMGTAIPEILYRKRGSRRQRRIEGRIADPTTWCLRSGTWHCRPSRPRFAWAFHEKGR